MVINLRVLDKYEIKHTGIRTNVRSNIRQIYDPTTDIQTDKRMDKRTDGQKDGKYIRNCIFLMVEHLVSQNLVH